MWMNGSSSASGTPAKARRTGKPSPSKPAGASVTVFTGRIDERSAGGVMRGSTRLSGTVTAGMAISLPLDAGTHALWAMSGEQLWNPPGRRSVPPGRWPGLQSVCVEAGDLVRGEFDGSCGGGGDGGLRAAAAGDGDDAGALGEHPGQRDLLGAGADLLGHGRKGGGGVLDVVGPSDAAERAPGDEHDAELVAVLELALRRAEAGRELVLHADEPAGEHPLRLVDLGHGGVGDAGHEDLALVEKVSQCADGLGPRNLGVRAVVLVEPDGIDAEAFEGRLACLFDVGGVAVHRPAAVAGAPVPALGGDEDVVGRTAVGGERLGDQLLAVAVFLDAQRVGVGGVDDRDAGIERRVDGGDGLAAVGAALDGEGHLAEADRADRPVADGTLLHGSSSWGAAKSGVRGSAPPQPFERYRRARSLARGRAGPGMTKSGVAPLSPVRGRRGRRCGTARCRP